jgi:hypothetical protein
MVPASIARLRIEREELEARCAQWLRGNGIDPTPARVEYLANFVHREKEARRG